MWYEPEFLVQSEQLKLAGRDSQFRAGSRIARGFADVGFEEFVLLPNGRSMSLFTGTQADFLEEHRGFFFEVPSIEELISELEIAGEFIVSSEFVDQRTWTVRTTNTSAESRSLHAALVMCLTASYERRRTV